MSPQKLPLSPQFYFASFEMLAVRGSPRDILRSDVNIVVSRRLAKPPAGLPAALQFAPEWSHTVSRSVERESEDNECRSCASNARSRLSRSRHQQRLGELPLAGGETFGGAPHFN